MSGWIRTFSGKKFYPTCPRPEDISIIDIAHHLSMIPRFTGALKDFFSIAQHSLFVASLVPEEDKLWALLHDASEAYTSDCNKPLKESLPDFQHVEKQIMKAVAQRFNLSWPMPCSVKKADMVALVSEATAHLPFGIREWPDMGCEVVLSHPLLVPAWPATAKRMFMNEFDRLDKLGCK